ncbi:MAG: hypothetical protein JWN03_3621 [Nocardia sp.]|uniref:hypothetical protein n=1 Tax=Nocardia sp. TaxID=1821 RepID=UPI0026238915|nr:hypothetical protein [Nocardia sp.]MCU1643346.1 hypothetical protein [Nocardia sp.]
MTTIATTRTTAGALRTVPAIAGVGYALSWVIALSIPVPSNGFGDSGSSLVAKIAGHSAAMDTNNLFSEGLPAIGLVIISLWLARAAGWSRAGRITAIAGAVAATISVVEFGIGLALARTTTPDTAHLLFGSLNRLDGVKMFVLAVMGVAAAMTGVLPRWLRYTGIAMAIAIAGSGIAYLLLNSGLATLAYVSLPLLIVFVTGTGIVLGRSAE